MHLMTKICEFLNLYDFMKNFSIEHLHTATLPAVRNVIFINGFLNETHADFTEWLASESALDATSNVYGVQWPSQSMADISEMMNALLQRKWGALLKNPWHRAMKNAEKAGHALGAALSQMTLPVTLVGHSLGCRVIYYALRHTKCAVDDVILLGGAVGNQSQDWENAARMVNGRIYNCHSMHDDVLKYSYRTSMAWLSAPIGYAPIATQHPKIANIDCSGIITRHGQWKRHYGTIYDQLYKNYQNLDSLFTK